MYRDLHRANVISVDYGTREGILFTKSTSFNEKFYGHSLDECHSIASLCSATLFYKTNLCMLPRTRVP